MFRQLLLMGTLAVGSFVSAQDGTGRKDFVITNKPIKKQIEFTGFEDGLDQPKHYQTNVHFADVNHGEKTFCRLLIQNSYTEAIRIKDIRLPCKCLRVGVGQPEAKPGESLDCMIEMTPPYRIIQSEFQQAFGLVVATAKESIEMRVTITSRVRI